MRERESARDEGRFCEMGGSWGVAFFFLFPFFCCLSVGYWVWERRDKLDGYRELERESRVRTTVTQRYHVSLCEVRTTYIRQPTRPSKPSSEKKTTKAHLRILNRTHKQTPIQPSLPSLATHPDLQHPSQSQHPTHNLYLGNRLIRAAPPSPITTTTIAQIRDRKKIIRVGYPNAATAESSSGSHADLELP